MEISSSDPELEIDDVLDSREKKRPLSPGSLVLCQFCGNEIEETEVAFEQHVGGHFEAIALKALPGTGQKGGGGNAGVFSLKQLPLGLRCPLEEMGKMFHGVAVRGECSNTHFPTCVANPLTGLATLPSSN